MLHFVASDPCVDLIMDESIVLSTRLSVDL